MQITDEIKKCVVFIGYFDQSKQSAFVATGTAFFICKPIENTNRNFSYIVTAKHVLQKMAEKGSVEYAIRFNLMDGSSQYATINPDKWFYHPDSDQNVDIAIMRAAIPEAVDHLALPVSEFLTDEDIVNEEINVGDELFFPGLFVKHKGTLRNIPIMRIGNIAAMPEEPLYTEKGLIDGYIVETRSIGGLSGSPVFLHLGHTRFREGKIQQRSGKIYYLLGIMNGHWNEVLPTPDGERLNMGLGIVTPVAKILEIINQPSISMWEEENK